MHCRPRDPSSAARTVVAAACLLLVAACSRSGPAPAGVDKKGSQAQLVEAVTVAPEAVGTTDERTGSIRARNVVRIHNREEGRIEALPFFESDAVRAGDLLAKIDDSLLRAELDKAEALTRQARIDLERVDGLVRKKAASEDELARARTELDVALAEQKILETRIDHTVMSAPFDGVISERLMEPGDMAAKDSHLLTLVDPGSLVVEVSVSELTLPLIAIGDPAEVRIDALGPGVIPGTIKRIYPVVDPATRQGIVEITLDELPAGIRPGQFARVRLRTAERPRLMVPFTALQRDRDGEFVYRLDSEDRAQPVRVRSGARVADRIEILEGVSAGDRIVSRGFLGLRPGAAVRVVQAATGD